MKHLENREETFRQPEAISESGQYAACILYECSPSFSLLLEERVEQFRGIGSDIILFLVYLFQHLGFLPPDFR